MVLVLRLHRNSARCLGSALLHALLLRVSILDMAKARLDFGTEGRT